MKIASIIIAFVLLGVLLMGSSASAGAATAVATLLNTVATVAGVAIAGLVTLAFKAKSK